MKKIYFILISITITVILGAFLFFFQIPSPSKQITESYVIEIK
tara:strand:+ start:1366 stop:1494 length:129 start_codon:yes stop_codon:yes gene_type:complete